MLCCHTQDMGTRWTGPASVETLVQKLAQAIGLSATANLAPGIGQMSSHDIGCLVKRLLNIMLHTYGECNAHSARPPTTLSDLVCQCLAPFSLLSVAALYSP